MARNKLIVWISLAILAHIDVCTADEADDTLPPAFRSGFYVAPLLSYTLTDKSRDNGTGNGIGGILTAGNRFEGEPVSFELEGYYTALAGSGETHFQGAELAVLFQPSLTWHALPNIYGLIGAGAHGPNRTAPILDAGLGYYFPFELFHRHMLVRAESRFRLDREHPPAASTVDPTSFDDVLFNLGLQIPLGPEPVAAVVPTPEPVEIVPVEEPAPPPPPAEPPPPPAAPPPCPSSASGETLNLGGCGTGDVIVLEGVNFDFNKDSLMPGASRILDGVVSELQTRPLIRVEIRGHTDGRGSAAYNLALSDRRAERVRQYLVQHGIDASRLTAHGYGKTQPIASNETDEGRARNRRVELKIVQ